MRVCLHQQIDRLSTGRIYHERVFIIGNGFDLAHGLKTGYFSFIDFLKETDYPFTVKLKNIIYLKVTSFGTILRVIYLKSMLLH